MLKSKAVSLFNLYRLDQVLMMAVLENVKGPIVLVQITGFELGRIFSKHSCVRFFGHPIAADNDETLIGKRKLVLLGEFSSRPSERESR